MHHILSNPPATPVPVSTGITTSSPSHLLSNRDLSRNRSDLSRCLKEKTMLFRKSRMVVLLCAVSFCSLAQEQFITINGKIIDASSRQGIPFVNLYIKPGTIGTASNTVGEFIFKYPASRSDDTLLITSIGYKPTGRPLKSLGRNVTITLEPSVVELAAVTVSAQTGLDILKEAIRRIPQNYDTSRMQLTAFYRENVWMGDFEVAFSEVVLDVYRPFYALKDQRNEQIRVIKGRKKKIEYGREGQLYYWMSGSSNGPRGCFSEDMVKYYNSKYSPLNPAMYKYYDYQHTETIRDEDRNLMVLDVTPKPKARKGYIPMKLFLDEETLAIVKYNFELSDRGIRMVSRKDKGLMHAIMANVVHVSTEYHKFQYAVSYSQVRDKWYLNRVTRHWEILVDSKKRNWEDRLWTLDANLVVTGIDTANAKPISEGDISKNSGPIHSMFSSDFDEGFWENYNVMKIESKSSPHRNDIELPKQDSVLSITKHISNRQNGFTRGDTLRGKLTPLRTCYDVLFYHLDVAVDMEKKSVSGNNLIRFVATQPFRRMQIDLFTEMTINKIVYQDKELPYTREYNAVFIDFPEMIAQGKTLEIKIYYEGIPKTPDWEIPMNGGVLWDKDSLGNPWVQMVCQGLGASVWWPNKDHQSDEPDSMKIWITVPSEFTEVSNGRLLRTTPQAGGRTRYEWYVSYPINTYNVTFNIGKYAHFNDLYVSDDTLTIDYYVMAYNVDRAKKMFRQVKPMLKTFEKDFGKYPFKRDGFTLVESLYPMEHQSGVCIGKITQQTSGDTSPLLWHESAHEWWGNAITCKDNADMWIHEGFATYAEFLVVEDMLGREEASLALAEQVNAVFGDEPVIGVYDVNHIHYEIGDMYSKASLMLHTFRNILNDDELWFSLLRDIQAHYRYKTLTSDELIAFINQRTKGDYTYFFDQYLRYKDIPTLEVAFEEGENNLKVKYRWMADVTNFRMPVKVTTAPDKFEFIYPTTVWKTMTLKNMSIDAFGVDEENFYINVEVPE